MTVLQLVVSRLTAKYVSIHWIIECFNIKQQLHSILLNRTNHLCVCVCLMSDSQGASVACWFANLRDCVVTMWTYWWSRIKVTITRKCHNFLKHLVTVQKGSHLGVFFYCLPRWTVRLRNDLNLNLFLTWRSNLFQTVVSKSGGKKTKNKWNQ